MKSKLLLLCLSLLLITAGCMTDDKKENNNNNSNLNQNQNTNNTKLPDQIMINIPKSILVEKKQNQGAPKRYFSTGTNYAYDTLKSRIQDVKEDISGIAMNYAVINSLISNAKVGEQLQNGKNITIDQNFLDTAEKIATTEVFETTFSRFFKESVLKVDSFIFNKNVKSSDNFFNEEELMYIRVNMSGFLISDYTKAKLKEEMEEEFSGMNEIETGFEEIIGDENIDIDLGIETGFEFNVDAMIEEMIKEIENQNAYFEMYWTEDNNKVLVLYNSDYYEEEYSDKVYFDKEKQMCKVEYNIIFDEEGYSGIYSGKVTMKENSNSDKNGIYINFSDDDKSKTTYDDQEMEYESTFSAKGYIDDEGGYLESEYSSKYGDNEVYTSEKTKEGFDKDGNMVYIKVFKNDEWTDVKTEENDYLDIFEDSFGEFEEILTEF